MILVFLKQHYEKLAFVVVLLAMLLIMQSMVRQLMSAEERVQDAEMKAESRVSGEGKADVEPLEKDRFQADTLLVSSKLLWNRYGKNQNGHLFYPGEVMVCKNPDCPVLMPLSMDNCPHCGVGQGKPPEEPKTRKGQDRDDDDIPDAVENQYAFLDRKTGEDAHEDEDGDYFSNLEEYDNQTDMTDPASHPPLAEKLRLLRVVQQRFPVQLKGVTKKDPEDKSTWDIQILYKGEAQFKSLGDKVGKYRIKNVSYRTVEIYRPEFQDYTTEPRAKVVLENEEGQEIVLKTEEETTRRGTVNYRLLLLSHPTSPRQCKRYSVSEERKRLSLEDTAGNSEKYEFTGVDRRDGRVYSITLTSQKTGRSFTIERLNPEKDFRSPKSPAGEGARKGKRPASPWKRMPTRR